MSSGVVTATASTLKIILLFTSLKGFGFIINNVGRIYALTIVVNCIALKRYKTPTTGSESDPSESDSTRITGKLEKCRKSRLGRFNTLRSVLYIFQCAQEIDRVRGLDRPSHVYNSRGRRIKQ
ncbi:hypothetical protein L218DRAFT_1002462 [Marasmius fiardii PR-910]|nr:hypothetical protein L218DRAFT_1002462 [Marasmius fiardii PR-910]